MLLSEGDQSEECMYQMTSNSMTFWRRQNDGDCKEFNGCQDPGGGREEYKGFQGTETILCEARMEVHALCAHGMYNTRSDP